MNDLHDLLHDAVDTIEPSDRLADLRARTASPERAAARPWFWAAGATVLATAAAVVIVAVVSSGPGDPDPAHHHHGMATDPKPAATGTLAAAYYFADTSDGPRLFREFHRVDPGNPLELAQRALTSPAADPDYRTAWPSGSVADTGFDGIGDDGVISVTLDRTAMLHRPEGLSREEAELAVQQVVHTFQAALQTQAPVAFYYGTGEPADQVYGISTPGAVEADPSALNPVSISDPAEGYEYAGSMVARGRASVLERHLTWSLTDTGGSVVRKGVAALSDKAGFRPWETTVDLTGLALGEYVFTATSDDTGFTVPSTDTRTITVE